MAFALTEEQSRAVHDRGGGLLVSAAAGSGKTRVLVERLLEGIDVVDGTTMSSVTWYTFASTLPGRTSFS